MFPARSSIARAARRGWIVPSTVQEVTVTSQTNPEVGSAVTSLTAKTQVAVPAFSISLELKAVMDSSKVIVQLSESVVDTVLSPP